MFIYIRLTYSRLGVLFVSNLSVWSGKTFGFCDFFFFLSFSNLPYSRPPLPQIVPREKRMGAIGCERVPTYLLLPAGVPVDASAPRMTYNIRVVWILSPSSVGRSPSFLLPSFLPLTPRPLAISPHILRKTRVRYEALAASFTSSSKNVSVMPSVLSIT